MNTGVIFAPKNAMKNTKNKRRKTMSIRKPSEILRDLERTNYATAKEKAFIPQRDWHFFELLCAIQGVDAEKVILAKIKVNEKALFVTAKKGIKEGWLR
jgi:hypothetical protein